MSSGRQLTVHTGYDRFDALTAALHALRALGRMWVRIQRAGGAARARHELHALSDRTLKDIGLSRGEIDSLFR
jgi:uncharacterized protein YjiS (DUF1127 family)